MVIPGPVLLKGILQGRRVETVFRAQPGWLGTLRPRGSVPGPQGSQPGPHLKRSSLIRSMFCSELLLKEIYSLKLKKKSTVK